MKTVTEVIRYQLRDIVRGRWVIAYTAFFLVTTEVLLRFGGGSASAILSLMNVVLLLIPLVSVAFGAIYLYDAREYTEFLLSQPVARPQLFAGLYIGLVIPLTIAFLLGIAIPFAIHGIAAGRLPTLLTLALAGALLTAVFLALAFTIAIRVDDKVKGLGLGIVLWLFFAVVYDGIVMIIVRIFAQYPLERPLIVLALFNPISLARILLLLQFDIAALLGYTGAVFRRFFGSTYGVLLTLAALGTWLIVPLGLALRSFQRKDF